MFLTVPRRGHCTRTARLSARRRASRRDSGKFWCAREPGGLAPQDLDALVLCASSWDRLCVEVALYLTTQQQRVRHHGDA
jgi:hypothetical protein